MVRIRRAFDRARLPGGGRLCFFFLPLDALSLVLCLTGLVMVAGGWSMLRWTWQSLVFLLFMIPLPYQVERMMGAELQNIATICTTFLLQTLGQPAIAEGNRILISRSGWASRKRAAA